MKDILHIARKVCRIALLSLAVGLQSCDDSSIKSLSEMKEEQETAIDRLIGTKGLKVVSLSGETLPSTIDPNVYYQMPNGLYMRVIKQGDMSRRAVRGQSKIYLRMKGTMFNHEEDSILVPNNYSNAGVEVIEFLYIKEYNQGDLNFSLIASPASTVTNLDPFMCQGLAYPMTLLGDGAEVSLIIPFDIGPSFTYNSGYTLYVEKAVYNFKN